MTNEELILELLRENKAIMQKTYESAEKTRKYFLYTTIITIMMIILPVIGLMIIIPQFLNTYSNVADTMAL